MKFAEAQSVITEIRCLQVLTKIVNEKEIQKKSTSGRMYRNDGTDAAKSNASSGKKNVQILSRLKVDTFDTSLKCLLNTL